MCTSCKASKAQIYQVQSCGRYLRPQVDVNRSLYIQAQPGQGSTAPVHPAVITCTSNFFLQNHGVKNLLHRPSSASHMISSAYLCWTPLPLSPKLKQGLLQR